MLISSNTHEAVCLVLFIFMLSYSVTYFRKDVKRNEEKIFSKKLFSELPLHPHLVRLLSEQTQVFNILFAFFKHIFVYK